MRDMGRRGEPSPPPPEVSSVDMKDPGHSQLPMGLPPIGAAGRHVRPQAHSGSPAVVDGMRPRLTLFEPVAGAPGCMASGVMELTSRLTHRPTTAHPNVRDLPDMPMSGRSFQDIQPRPEGR